MLVHNQIQKRTNVVKCYGGSDRYQLIDDAAISVQKPEFLIHFLLRRVTALYFTFMPDSYIVM